MKIGEWLIKNVSELETESISSARLDCLLLLEFAHDKPREWVLSHDDTELSNTQLQNLNNLIARRINHEPVAYIIGSKEFYGRDFMVSPDVLIPRPESETMIELLLSLPTTDHRPPTIIDIGTGSGCLAITAKLEMPDAKVIATDISEAAIEVARKNAANLKSDIEFLKCDLLPTIDHPLWTVLANLPYVPEDLITSEEITKEPDLALFSGKDGMDHYRKFWNQVNGLKDKPSYVITESLADQHQSMQNLAQQAGYTLVKTETLAQLFNL